jgi:hypothetical protein
MCRSDKANDARSSGIVESRQSQRTSISGRIEIADVREEKASYLIPRE